MSIRLPAGVGPAPVAPMVQYAAAPPPAQHARDMPDPQSVAQQKDAYSKSLDQQLHSGRQQIIAENAQKRKALLDAAAHQKSMYMLQIDQEVKKQEMMLDQEMAKKLHDLEKAAHDQRAILEQQAATLTMEFNTKLAHEQYEHEQTRIKRSYDDAHAKINAEQAKLQPAVAMQPTMQPQMQQMQPQMQQMQPQMQQMQPQMQQMKPAGMHVAAPPTVTAGSVMAGVPSGSYTAAPTYAMPATYAPPATTYTARR